VNRRKFLAAGAGMSAAAVSVSRAFAVRGRAFIDHAVPGVGLTVIGPVREVRLYFDMGVVAAGVQVRTSAGAVVPASRPLIDSSGGLIVTVRLGRALGPGTYLVGWHVMSVARWPTSGTFRFKVS